MDGIICVPLSKQQFEDLHDNGDRYDGPNRCGPWKMTKGPDCYFSGNLTDSADATPSPLVRTGDCKSMDNDELDFSSKGITSVPEDVFANMENVK